MSSEQDRELLELAAKAAGIVGEYYDNGDFESIWWNNEDDCVVDWNPLTDDSDALMLAVYLGIDLSALKHEYTDGDPCTASRRAITRAAAALASGTPSLGDVGNYKTDNGLAEAYQQLKAAYSKPSAARTRAEAWRALDGIVANAQGGRNE